MDGKQLAAITKNENELATIVVYFYPSGEVAFKQTLERVPYEPFVWVTIWNPYDANVFALYCLKKMNVSLTEVTIFLTLIIYIF